MGRHGINAEYMGRSSRILHLYQPTPRVKFNNEQQATDRKFDPIKEKFKEFPEIILRYYG